MRKIIGCVAAMMCAMGIAGEVAAAGQKARPDPAAITLAASQGQYDAVFSICQTMAPLGGADYANQMSPLAAAMSYFQTRGIALESTEPSKVTVVSGPQHGSLATDAKLPENVFIYKPIENYLGTDQMIFTVDVKGKILKVIFSVEVGIKELSNSASGSKGNARGQVLH